MANTEVTTLWKEIERQATEDYLTFLRFPSISSSLEHIEQVKECCQWLAEWMRERGIEVDIWETTGHPAIFGELKCDDPEAPTLLLYGHYDVQPVEPESDWTGKPFEPTISDDGVVTARGAQDNKGQCFYTLLAVTSLLKKHGKAPIHIKFLIEGEEEIGSPSLVEWLEKKKEAIQADYVAVVDVEMKDRESPAITLSARGIITMEVEAKGTATDLHSGSHGGLAYNPIFALSHLLADLKDPESGRVTVPGFYDNIAELSEEERSQVDLEFDEEAYESTFKQKPTGGEVAHPPAERVGLRPTLEINGFKGGYTGPGFKTVIPAKANAWLSCRLVPNQNPEEVGNKVKQFLLDHAPEGIDLSVRVLPGVGEAVRVLPDSPIVHAFKKAILKTFGKEPALMLEGGSIPIAAQLAKAAGAAPIFFGVGLHDDQIHAADEHFDMERFEKGFTTIIHLIETLAEK